MHQANLNILRQNFSSSVEIVPVCKDSVVCLSSKMAHQLGGIGQICIVHRITNVICLIDPNTAQSKETILHFSLFHLCVWRRYEYTGMIVRYLFYYKHYKTVYGEKEIKEIAYLFASG